MIIYLVTPELLRQGVERGVFVGDPRGIAPAWYAGEGQVPAGPIYPIPWSVPPAQVGP